PALRGEGRERGSLSSHFRNSTLMLVPPFLHDLVVFFGGGHRRFVLIRLLFNDEENRPACFSASVNYLFYREDAASEHRAFVSAHLALAALDFVLHVHGSEAAR